MDGMAAEAFEAIYDSMTEARATLRVGGRETIARCLCSGLPRARVDTDEGQVLTAPTVVRYLKAEESRTEPEVGDTVELQSDAIGDRVRVRVVERLPHGGMVRLTVEAEYGV